MSLKSLRSPRSKPSLRSAAYTGHWAKELGVAPESLDPRLLIDAGVPLSIQQENRSIIARLMKKNLVDCGDQGQISPPTYPAARILPDEETYHRAADVMHAIRAAQTEEYLKKHPGHRVSSLHSIAFRPDGFIPSEGETFESLGKTLIPQFQAAVRHDALPVVEAATTRTRIEAAFRAAHACDASMVEVCFAVDPQGTLAVDQTNFEEILELKHHWRSYFDTIYLGTNCGSHRGCRTLMEKFPGEIWSYYPNKLDGLTITEQDLLGRPDTSEVLKREILSKAHHVGIDEVAHTLHQYNPGVLSVCCGWEEDALSQLERLITRDSQSVFC